MTGEGRESWIGLTIGPWTVVEPFKDSRGKSRYRCINVEAGNKVVGITARDLSKHRNRMRRDGIEPARLDVWTLVEALRLVEIETTRRRLLRAAPGTD